MNKYEIEVYCMTGDTLSRRDTVQYYDVTVFNNPVHDSDSIVEEHEDLNEDQLAALLVDLEVKYDTDAEVIDGN